LYILKGKSLTPKDSTTSDPYLIIKLAGKVITDKESLRPKTCNPSFFRSYDIPVSLPGAATLEIECWDDDGFDFPDLIGATKIDLEDRYFNKEWKKLVAGDKKSKEAEIELLKLKAEDEDQRLKMK
jgi:Ca2+-dependent lipid-binding protein